jgi:hypothetical protein
VSSKESSKELDQHKKQAFPQKKHDKQATAETHMLHASHTKIYPLYSSQKNLSTFIVSSTKMLQKIMSVMNDRASFNYLAKKCKFVTIMTLQVNTTPES